jgi:hypothetical protein
MYNTILLDNFMDVKLGLQYQGKKLDWVRLRTEC